MARVEAFRESSKARIFFQFIGPGVREGRAVKKYRDKRIKRNAEKGFLGKGLFEQLDCKYECRLIGCKSGLGGME